MVCRGRNRTAAIFVNRLRPQASGDQGTPANGCLRLRGATGGVPRCNRACGRVACLTAGRGVLFLSPFFIMSKSEDRWTADARKLLQGRRIVDVRYLTPQEIEAIGWATRPVALQLDNGVLIWPSADDEGNDAGALFGEGPGDDCWGLPVIR